MAAYPAAIIAGYIAKRLTYTRVQYHTSLRTDASTPIGINIASHSIEAHDTPRPRNVTRRDLSSPHIASNQCSEPSLLFLPPL
jgi:hypothetical protein